MTKQKGREMLLAISDGAAGFDVIAGITAKTLSINNNLVDVSTPNAAAPGDIIVSESQTGIRTFAVSGDIIFETTVEAGKVEATSRANPPSDQFQVTIPGYGTYTAVWMVESFEWSGEQEGAVQATISLKASGDITFAAV